MFNSPNTAAMMGTVAPHRRGIAAGARVLVQNTGAVLSIAFVMAIITAAVPKSVLFNVFSGLGAADHQPAAGSVPGEHAHRAVVPDRGLAPWRGGVVRAAQARLAGRRRRAAPSRGGDGLMAAESASAQRSMRIGEVAELTGTTPRTIRYYEEIGLLGSASDREQGKHRCYTEADVERIREVVRLRDLLGLSLEQLSQLVEAETARAEIRRELGETDDPARRRELLMPGAGPHRDSARLVRERLDELGALEEELVSKQRARRREDRGARLTRPSPRRPLEVGRAASRLNLNPASARPPGRRPGVRASGSQPKRGHTLNSADPAAVESVPCGAVTGQRHRPPELCVICIKSF